MLRDCNKKYLLYFIITIIIFLLTIVTYKHFKDNKFKFNLDKLNVSFFTRKKLENWFFKQLHVGNTLDKVTGIIIEAYGDKFTIVKEGQNWLILEKYNYPASVLKIKEIIFGLADLKIIEAKTSKPENFAEINLEDLETSKNTTKITLLDANHQKIASIYLGAREFIASPTANYQNHIFVRRPEEPNTWLVSGSLPESFNFKDLVKQPLLNIIPENIMEIRLIKAKEPKNFIYIKRSLTNGDLSLLDIPKNYKLKDQYVIDNIINQFNYLNYEDVIKEQPEAVKVLDIQLTLDDLENLDTDFKNKNNLAKKSNTINLEIVYLYDKYYLKAPNNLPVKDFVKDPAKDQDHTYWLYKISDYSIQSWLINKKDLITEIKSN